MLQKIRDRASGPLAWIIVGIISIPFAFFGIEAFRTDPGTNDVAVVGDEEISEYELSRQYDQRYRQLQEMLGENFRADLIDPEALRGSVLEGLVQASVVRQYLDERGYRVSDAQVRDFIRGQEAFQVDGKFSRAQYREVLGRQGQSPAGYEDRVREYLTSEQLRTAVADTHFSSPGELAESYRLAQQKRTVAARRYAARQLASDVEITDEQIAARYEERRAALRAPERVRLAYLEISRAALTADLQATAEDLRAIYEAERDSRFTLPEQRKAAHILVRVTADQDSGSAREKIEAAAARLAAGEDFAALAAEISEDPGSKDKGGDLGWVRRGVMVPAFEEALFGMAAGTVSEPVETSFGWHLIRLAEVRKPTVQAFEDASVQERLLGLYRDREGRKLMQEKGDQLSELTFENPASLQPAADALGLEIQQTEWFTRDGGAGIAAEDAVVEAAFSDIVLEAQENSQPLLVGDRQIVVRLLEHEAAREQSLDEVREQLAEELRLESGRKLARELAEAEWQQLQVGAATWDALPQSEVVTVTEARAVTRDDRTLGRALLNRAFELDRPDGSPVYAVVPLPDGDAALLSLSKVEDGDWAAASDAEREQLKRQLAGVAANREFGALQEQLRAAVKVKLLTPDPE